MFLAALAIYSLVLICLNEIITPTSSVIFIDDIFVALKMLYFSFALIVIGRFVHTSFDNIKTCLNSLILALFVVMDGKSTGKHLEISASLRLPPIFFAPTVNRKF